MARFAPSAVLFASLLGLIGCYDGTGGSPPLMGESTRQESASPATAESGEVVHTPLEGGNSSRTGEAADSGKAVGETSSKLPSQTDSDSVPTQEGSGKTANHGSSTVGNSSPEAAGYVQVATTGAGEGLPKHRTFRPEGPEQALRITYDDLDLLKWLQMDPVVPNCVEQMPEWMRDLNGKKVRLRGFMKPHEISTGFRRFIFVKDTGLCCFGPAGKIYDLIQVTLQKGTTTDYIELTPFDVIGTFRIEIAALEDTQEVYELFHIDDAKIMRK
jgi:hypothetical protein